MLRIRTVLLGIAFFGAALPARAFAAGPARPALDCPPGTQPSQAFMGYERATWCGRKDGTREGPWILWYDYDARRKKEEGSFTKGVRNGQWTTWSSEGKPSSQGAYSDGTRVGKWVTWFASGQIEQIATYIDGVPDGEWVTFFKNGNKAEEGRMVRGLPIGPWVYYYENGRKLREGSFKGISIKKNGPIENTYEEGRWSYYYPDGRKQREGEYKVGLREGIWREWTEKGKELTTRYVGGVAVD